MVVGCRGVRSLWIEFAPVEMGVEVFRAHDHGDANHVAPGIAMRDRLYLYPVVIRWQADAERHYLRRK